ncbi:hypothetical protein AB00_5610 [Raoultella ornithinolytica 2-156-04_S1_C1]|nr:hypothetical protein AB00_5610 [Raoultella ornithinolytica 2-156-04_S1_C1]
MTLISASRIEKISAVIKKKKLTEFPDTCFIQTLFGRYVGNRCDYS